MRSIKIADRFKAPYVRLIVLLIVITAFYPVWFPAIVRYLATEKIPKQFTFQSDDLFFDASVYPQNDQDYPYRIKLVGISNIYSDRLITNATSLGSAQLLRSDCGITVSDVDAKLEASDVGLRYVVYLSYETVLCASTKIPKITCSDAWINLPFGGKTKVPGNCTQTFHTQTIKTKIGKTSENRSYSVSIAENQYPTITVVVAPAEKLRDEIDHWLKAYLEDVLQSSLVDVVSIYVERQTNIITDLSNSKPSLLDVTLSLSQPNTAAFERTNFSFGDGPILQITMELSLSEEEARKLVSAGLQGVQDDS